MKYESIEDLSVEQRLQLNKLIAEALSKRDAFTTEEDVRYFVTDDYLDELNSAEMPDEDYYIDDYSDDAEALASAGWGTDEDYGHYGEDY